MHCMKKKLFCIIAKNLSNSNSKEKPGTFVVHGSFSVSWSYALRLVDYTSKEEEVIPIANDEQERGSNMKHNPFSFGGILAQK